MGRQQQSQSLFESILDLIEKYNSQPFQDYYFLLVFRFIVYIYVFIQLSDIFLGYAKPNLKTRILRKFQFVYDNQILKQLDHHDMQELELTINNTIINATKDLKPQSHQIMIEKNNKQTVKNMIHTERGFLKNDQNDSLRSSQSSKRSKLTFHLQKNDYYDPPSKTSSIIQQKEEENISEESFNKMVDFLDEKQNNSLMVEKNQPSQENATLNNEYNMKNNKNNTFSDYNDQSPKSLLSKEPNQQDQENSPLKSANTHYPEIQMSGIDPSTELKLIHDQQLLLHLSQQNLEEALSGNSPSKQKQQNQHFQEIPSIIKSESTNITENLMEQLDT